MIDKQLMADAEKIMAKNPKVLKATIEELSKIFPPGLKELPKP
jgi:hypothetical protein